ncbi:MAG: hypothetical protein A3J38_06635 [Gammaproteobacteria bacterium RIFCSPHIGHO2_12_FULL_45_9]|nr:MAG: hypothetical protein A3J38_06635 [Gammaproteobacteria bacterium RIFCSPHIGHO2_12_FULL_45_9]
MRILLLGLLICLGMLQYELWFSPNGWWHATDLKVTIAQQDQQNRQLKERNDMLLAEIRDLQHGTLAIESRARSELGWVKRGEVFYQFTAPPSTDKG